MSFSGTLPLANGGTNVAASSYSNLFDTILSNDNSPSVTLSVARLGANSIDSTKLTNTGVSTGIFYNNVEVDSAGRVISANVTPQNSISDGSGDAVSVGTVAGGTITFSIGGHVDDVINDLGYLGLGTTNPTQELSVNAGNILIEGPSATNRQLEYATTNTGAPVERWSVMTNSTAEGGTDTGSDFVIQNYSDTGIAINTTTPALTILRANGAATFEGSITAPGFTATGTPGFTGDGSGLTGIPLSAIDGGLASGITLGTSALDTNPQRKNDQTTGLFSPVSGAVSVSSLGTEMMRVNGTGVAIGSGYVGTAPPTGGLIVQGNVGIGVTVPGQTLEVGGTAKIDTGLIASLIYPSGDSAAAIQFDKANGATNVLDIDTTNGRVGIGSTGPMVSLDLSQNTDALALPIGSSGLGRTAFPACSVSTAASPVLKPLSAPPPATVPGTPLSPATAVSASRSAPPPRSPTPRA